MSSFSIYNDENFNNLSSNNVSSNSGNFSGLRAANGNINLLTLGQYQTAQLTPNFAGNWCISI